MTDVEARRAFVLTRRKSGVTFREIGRELGISPSRASQLHAAAVEALERIPPDVYVTSETPLCELPLNWQTRQILAQEPCLTVSQYLAIDEPDRPSHILPLFRFGRRHLNELETFLKSDAALMARARLGEPRDSGF